MFRQRHEVRVAAPLTEVFSALARTLARNRWGSGNWLDGSDALPKVGQLYGQQRGSVYRRGRVVECLRPVVITLYESLFDSPCRVRLRLRWRIEPLDGDSLVRLEASFELNGPAYLNRRHWDQEIRSHCRKLLKALIVRLDQPCADVQTGASGQKIGSNNMTETNTTAVNGSPTFK